MGRDGLLTYRYLGRRANAMHGVPHDSMVVRRDMRNALGGLMAAPLAIASAEAGGFTDFDAVAAPITASLSVLDAGVGVTELRIVQEVVHRGRSMGFTRAVIRDAADPSRVLALSRGTGIKLAAAPPEGGTFFELGDEIPDGPDLPPLTEAFGARCEDGVWSLPALNADTSSTSGSLHLGPIHILLEAAATEAAMAQAGGAAVQVEEWEVMFVGRGSVGPFVAAVDGAYRAGARIGVRVSLRDAGTTRIVSVGTGTFGIPAA